jgi:hypothetical protein
MVADEGSNDGRTAFAARIRGWGRIQYLDNAEKLQEAVGHLVAEALNQLWLSHNQQQTHPPLIAP